MNATPYGATARQGAGIVSDEQRPENPLDAAWIVLDAANDLGDHATVETCRRVIDASLKGATALPSDWRTIFDYFK
jgi:hypothetical protein